MSLRETLEAAVAQLEEAHEKNRVEYRKALAVRDEANELVRRANDVASVTANELGAAKKALQELNQNAPEITGSGEVEAEAQ